MAFYIQQLKCCAFYEYSGLDKDPMVALTYLWKARWNERNTKIGRIPALDYAHDGWFNAGIKKPFMMFTEQVGTTMHVYQDENRYGKILAKFILENKLGEITETPVRMNWTGYRVMAYIWAIDWDKFTDFMNLKGVSKSWE